MASSGLKRARELTSEGFHYDNLVKMAQHCRAEEHAERLLGAFVLNRVFMQMAEDLGDGPVLSSELRKMEARCRTAVNLALEAVSADAAREEQHRRLTDLIQILWRDPERA